MLLAEEYTHTHTHTHVCVMLLVAKYRQGFAEERECVKPLLLEGLFYTLCVSINANKYIHIYIIIASSRASVRGHDIITRNPNCIIAC